MHHVVLGSNVRCCFLYYAVTTDEVYGGIQVAAPQLLALPAGREQFTVVSTIARSLRQFNFDQKHRIWSHHCRKWRSSDSTSCSHLVIGHFIRIDMQRISLNADCASLHYLEHLTALLPAFCVTSTPSRSLMLIALLAFALLCGF